MKFSIIYPSRSRPFKAQETVNKWIDTAFSKVDVVMSIDSDDPWWSNYMRWIQSTGIRVGSEFNKNIVEAVNRVAGSCKGDILIVISDDFSPFEGWDAVIEKALEGKSGVLKTWDGIQKRIVTLPIMTRDYYDKFGFVFNPAYTHSWCDTELTEVAERLGMLHKRLDIHFPHNHYSVTGEQPDELYKRNDATHDSGRKIFQERQRINFGL